MRLCAPSVLLALLPVSGGATAAERDWFPPPGEEASVTQLAGWLGEIAPERPIDDGQLRERARKEVRGQRARLESWGEKGIVKHAPDLSKLELPASGDRLLDVMARYYMCGAALMLKHLDRAREKDATARRTTAKGLSGTALTVLYLRHSFVEKGTEARVEAFLTGKALEVPFNRIQDRQDLREYTAGQCRPVVSALVDVP